MTEWIVVIGIVAVATFFVTRSFYRTVKGGRKGCACSQACPLAKDCSSLAPFAATSEHELPRSPVAAAPCETHANLGKIGS